MNKKPEKIVSYTGIALGIILGFILSLVLIIGLGKLLGSTSNFSNDISAVFIGYLVCCIIIMHYALRNNKVFIRSLMIGAMGVVLGIIIDIIMRRIVKH